MHPSPHASHLTERDALDLLAWYRAQKRDLPWRINRDPYRIWISEVMLQQTTVRAVIPYYERFIKRFPTIEKLAQADSGDVLELWAGLGYYSRARNLHKAAKVISQQGSFPKSYRDLITLPGFGPYTARAVSSIAFDEPVGVLDGNVIRVLCRLLSWDIDWWQPKRRENLQAAVDHFVQPGPSGDLNQALMELGATICTPGAPACLLCPLQKSCQANQTGMVELLPRKRPRREREIWAWQPVITMKQDQIAFVPNTYAPFLKGQLIYPGSVKRLKQVPKHFDFRHSVTHHDIFVTVKADPKAAPSENVQWVEKKTLAKVIPLALVQKALEHMGERKK